VVEHGKQPSRLAVGVDIQSRANEAPATYAEPAPDNLEAVGARPPRALYLESDLGGRGLGVISDSRHP
jgi:hypothetical protein